jgi:hypothetical protein
MNKRIVAEFIEAAEKQQSFSVAAEGFLALARSWLSAFVFCLSDQEIPCEALGEEGLSLSHAHATFS